MPNKFPLWVTADRLQQLAAHRSSALLLLLLSRTGSLFMDADILDVFLAKGPDLVPTTVPKGMPGKRAAAAMPAQQVTGAMAAVPFYTHAPAQQQTAMPPGVCQVTSLGQRLEKERSAKPHAGTVPGFNKV